MDKTTRVYISRGVLTLYLTLAVVLVPWIFNLAYSLPTKHVAGHWDTLWVGFDSMMLSMVIATIYFALRRKIWAVVTATILATLFIVDAWFDVLTAKTGKEQHIAIVFGALEVALALFTFRMVYHVIKTAHPVQHRIKITSHKPKRRR